MKQERDTIAANVEVAAVNVGDMWQGVKIFDGWAVRIMQDLPILAI